MFTSPTQSECKPRTEDVDAGTGAMDSRKAPISCQILSKSRQPSSTGFVDSFVDSLVAGYRTYGPLFAFAIRFVDGVFRLS